jgi:ABC-type glutathione transport system ATPase component
VNVLDITDLHVAYRTSTWGRRREAEAVAGANLSVGVAETVGLVGASGAGKSTLAKAIVHLVRAERGHIRVGDFDVTGFGRRAPLAFRKTAQLVFQRTSSSLNPALSVGEIVAEPLRLHFQVNSRETAVRTARLLDTVGLPESFAGRRPHELSVGQRQRVCIARALATEPSLVVLDEPVSALDARTRGQVVSMLEELQHRTEAGYLLITHDIALARHLCARIAVMQHGRVVEEGPAPLVCEHPRHSFTQLLIASLPDPDPTRQRAAREQRRRLATEVPPT